MGGFLTTCKQRRSLHVTDNNSNIDDDRTLPRFIPHTSLTPPRRPRVRIQDERKSETSSSTYASIPHERLRDLKKRRDDLFVLRDLKKRRDDLFVKDEPSQGYSSNYPQPGNKKEPLPDYDYDDEQRNDNFFEHQTIIRDRGLRTVSSRITLHSENKSETYNIESESYYDFSYMWSEKASAKVEVHEPTQLPHQKIIMAESSNSEKGMKEKEFQVIKDTKFLPRYIYHRSLLDWFMEDIPQDPMFQACHFTDCTILIGGNIKDETISKICGETTLREKLTVKDLRKEAVRHTQSLIVYFLRSNVIYEYKEIEQIVNQLSFEGTFLFVMTSEIFHNEQMKSTLKENVLELGNLNVEIVFDDRSEILSKMTRVLEQRLIVYLEQTKMKLRDYSRHHNVRLSLREVKAILRRLKQAACYPEPLKDEEEEEDPQEKEVEEILKSFGDKIIYKKYDGDTLYVITTDQEVKERLDVWYTKSGIKNINFETTVDAKLSISELTKSGVPLHGAKIVYVNEDVEAFKIDEAFATTGSLMMANGESMVIVTCRHALRNGHVYTLIDNTVVRLGQGIQQQQNNMNRLNEDIAVVQIDEETRSVITNKCEKLLIDKCGYPTPAQISLSELRKDDIVHKRGANTGLTTGLVNSVKNITVTGFNIPSPTILIQGKDGKPFAEKGDSGSLVFKHSYSVESNILDVIGMVQGKTLVPISNPDIICFPFHEGRDFLIGNNQDVDCLQFYNV